MADAKDPIDRINTEAETVAAVLRSGNHASLGVAAEDIFRRSLVLAAGSYFELRLCGAIESFCAAKSNNNTELCEFVKNKALTRQYHTFFDWNSSNVNKFTMLFGKDFKDRFERRVKGDSDLADGLRAFLQLSGLRNQLAHENFADVKFDLTRDDVLRMYRKSMVFISIVEESLRA